ncbi:hypothetical protein C8R47DRAFT_6694 [Mycena vitilis]|nr:hypothetical protein C8R47DRAFT_6694 [Mycena vitilis]
MSLEDYHAICYFYLCQWWQRSSIPENVSIEPGSIRHAPSRYDDSIEIAAVSNCVVFKHRWSTEDPIVMDLWHPVSGNEEGTLTMENGWIRVNSTHVAEIYNCQIWVDNHSSVGWLAQANHIFDRLNITRELENYVCVATIEYWLEFSASTRNLPPGYLFLGPLTDHQYDLVFFRTPDCPAYWSLDRSGAERLTSDEAGALGFPDIH